MDTTLFSRYVIKSLDGNRKFESIESSFGNNVISSYVGFIDLKGFSESSRGKTPDEVYNFIKPFLDAVINEVTRFDCLIDKTIGDEVMFVLQDSAEDGMGDGFLKICQLLGALRELALASENNLCFRIGVSFGDLKYVKLGNDKYHEFTVFGEPVHVAKRLMSLQELEDPRPVVCAFGRNNHNSLDELIRFGKFNVKWSSSPPENRDLKGVGTVDFIVLMPHPAW